jgi:sulfatase modifying factor 1
MFFRVSMAALLLALTGCQAQSEPFPSSSKLAPAKVKAIAATITKRHPNLSAEQHDAVLRTVVRSLDEMVFIEGGEFDMGDFGWPCDRALTELCEWPCGVPLDQL